VLRPATDADRDTVVALALAEDLSWFGEALHTAEEMGEFIDEIGVAAGAVVTADDGRIRGYAGVGAAKESVLVVDPADPAPPVAELATWMRERGGTGLYTYGEDTARQAALQASGWQYAFSSYDLSRPGADPVDGPNWPDGITVETFDPDRDAQAVYRLIYVDAAWAEQTGHLERPFASWQQMLSAEDKAWVAWRAQRPVGFALGRVFGNGRAWIHQIAVAPDERRHGLGRALLLYAYGELLAAGATSLGLNVQASNEKALGLYRSVVLEVTREWRIFAPA
jgi:ribosomal protein S18 acetylase RimI-like enzyme